MNSTNLRIYIYILQKKAQHSRHTWRFTEMTELSSSLIVMTAKTSEIKKIIRAFKLLGLRIEIASNLKIVDFLHVTLSLDNGTFKPFSKSNSTPTNINIDSNHPRSILKQIPNAVNQRIDRLSSCKKKFWGEKKDIWWSLQTQRIPRFTGLCEPSALRR